MDIKETREVRIELDNKTLRDRVMQAAARGGFNCTSDLENQWIFKRGHMLHGLYSFDVHKLPCEMIISRDTDDEKLIKSSMHQTNPLVIATSNTRRYLTNEIDLLVAYIKGAL